MRIQPQDGIFKSFGVFASIAYSIRATNKRQSEQSTLCKPCVYAGFFGIIHFPFGQGYISMSPPSKDFYQFVMQGKIRHGRHPVLDWNMSNLIVESDAAGNIKPSKKKSTEKIDGCVAMIMGFARASIGGNIQMSIYDQRDLFTI